MSGTTPTIGARAARPLIRSHSRRGSLTARLLANEWATAALIFVATRSVALVGAYAGVIQAVEAAPERDKGWVAEMALTWDAAWYVLTSIDGYSYDPFLQSGSNIAFPPLLPALLAAFARFLQFVTFGWDWGHERYGAWVVAGLIISNVSFFAALALLIRSFTPRLGRQGAAFAVFGLAALPLAFFFSAIYTEGLFLLLSLGAWMTSRTDWRGKWMAAGALGLLAVLLKFAGVLLAPVLLVEYMSQRGWSLRKVRPNILWIGLVPAGLLIYMLFLWLRFDDPLAFLDAQAKGWYHRTSFFLTTYWEDAVVRLWRSMSGELAGKYDFILEHGSGNRLYAILDLLMPPLLLLGAFVARKKLYAAEWAWLVLGIIYPLSAGHTNSLARYMLPLWPGILWLGMLGKRGRWLGIVLLMACLALQMWSAGIYANAKWIG